MELTFGHFENKSYTEASQYAIPSNKHFGYANNFAFSFTNREWSNLKSQFVTSSRKFDSSRSQTGTLENRKANFALYPAVFMFQLNQNEWETLQSQNATAKRSALPCLFTKKGVSRMDDLLTDVQTKLLNHERN